MKDQNNFGIRTMTAIVLILSAFILFCTDAHAETWKDYLDMAKKAKSKDHRDVVTVKSLLLKAMDAAGNTNDCDGLYQVAEMYNKIDSNQDAVRCLNKAADVAENKKDAKSLIKISDFLRTLMKHNEALNCVRSAERIAEDNQDKTLMMNISSAYLRLGDNNKAESCRRKAEGFSGQSHITPKGSRDNPYSARIQSLKSGAQQLISQNRKENAIESLREAMSLAEKSKDSAELREIGSIFKSAGSSKYAEKCNELAVRIERSAKATPVPVIKATTSPTAKTATTPAGKSELKSKKSVTGDSWQTEFSAGNQYLAEGKKSKAFDKFNSATGLAEAAKDWDGLVSIGDVFLNAGKKSKAYSCYMKAKAAASAKKDPKGLRLIASKFNSLKDKNAANQCIKKAEYFEKRK